MGLLAHLVSRLHRDYNSLLGIDNTMRLCKAVNRVLYGRRQRRHDRLYRERIGELLEGNDGSFEGLLPRNLMRDGWALDLSGGLPHLGRLLEDAAPLIEERGGRDRSGTADAQQPFLYNLLEQSDLERFPSFLDFALSSEVLGTVAHHMGTIPVLSRTSPPGVRFMESNAAFDPEPEAPPRHSQNFHLDLHDRPVVYVLVLLRDTTERSGPWTFLPASTSDRGVRLLDYQSRSVDYRVPDEQMYSVVDPSEAITFAHPRGAVLFIESGRCFHYGSRNAVVPRYMMMYGFTTLCRADLKELVAALQGHPVGEAESELRRLVLRR